MSDFTLEMQLCGDDGFVSTEEITGGPPTADKTFLDRHNRLRNMSLAARGDKPQTTTEEFVCTGSAHLAGEHIRCTSPAHVPGAVTPPVDPLVTEFIQATSPWTGVE